MRKLFAAAVTVFSLAVAAVAAAPADHPNILQRPALSATMIAFGYAGDLWVVPRDGGKATRLTAGVGIETQPVFSPDGQTIAFTGEYDGNVDVYTIPVTGSIPKRITFHPGPDYAVGWTPDGTNILFRSGRASYSRYTQLFTVPASGGQAKLLPLPPIANEAPLRNVDWIDANQRRVDQLSGGKLAYVYLPDTAAGGFTNFNRYYFAQTNKQGAIVDERFNSGGQVADYIIEVLGRRLEAYWAPRYGAIERTPDAGIYGPKVMIANEFSGSGGDAMPWLFKYNHEGVLVGKRTWGGLVGIGNIPVLMDGGNVTSPSVAFFSPEGQWDVENHGVDPDVVVEQDPKAVSEGHDPQLEKAVAVALDELAKHPAPEPHRPAYPNYSY